MASPSSLVFSQRDQIRTFFFHLQIFRSCLFARKPKQYAVVHKKADCRETRETYPTGFGVVPLCKGHPLLAEASPQTTDAQRASPTPNLCYDAGAANAAQHLASLQAPHQTLHGDAVPAQCARAAPTSFQSPSCLRELPWPPTTF